MPGQWTPFDDFIGPRKRIWKEAVVVAVGLFLIATAYTWSRQYQSLSAGRELLYVNVAFGILLSTVYAYRNGGLLISWMLVFAPIAGGLAVYAWAIVYQGTLPDATPFALWTHDGVEWWFPTGLVLGTASYVVGLYSQQFLPQIRSGQ